MITVEHIHSKINKKLGLLRRVKLIYLLSLGWLFSIALFYPIPYLIGPDYGEIIWGDQGNSALTDDLQVLQNKAARIILDFPPHASSSDALAKLHWKPLLRRRAGHRAIFINKSIDKLFSMPPQFSLNRDFDDCERYCSSWLCKQSGISKSPGVFGSVIPGLYHELWRHRDTRRERRSLAHSLPVFGGQERSHRDFQGGKT